MLRVQAGDLEAFESLVERFESMVYGLAISMLRRPEDAEEAAQDTFLKLFRARDQFDGTRKLGPWLLRIAGNACRDRLRRRRVAELPTVRTDVGERDLLNELPDPRATATADQLGPTVRAQLDQLSDKVRLPMELKYLRGQTNHEIAAALGISVSNVKVQIARGKDILQSRLEGLGVSFGREATAQRAQHGRTAEGGSA
ncbi:MAG: sigma-70 family RNA polymerase sigma factor [Planctomycetes bacterium]|nr:sigma-70 family RNA polymerase sigma factor [Planctomycetota bacterium]